jgi:hypothetical protein
MIELPETLEDILVLSLEHTGRTGRNSFYTRFYRQSRADQLGYEIRQHIIDWLVRIMRFPGVVTNERIPWGPSQPAFFRVQVAGVEICTISNREKISIFGESA